jgi:hypothetical protein
MKYIKKVLEKKKLDPVDSKELAGKHTDREDKDIDNDGDVDSSDQYLHKKRKAISKSAKTETKVVIDPVMDNAPKKDKNMANEETTSWPVYARILEARKVKSEAEPTDANQSTNSKDFKKLHTDNMEHAPTSDEGDAATSEAGKEAPETKKRPGDNTDTDKMPTAS